MGNPITHSKSPQIHTAFAEQTKQNIFYQAISAEQDAFKEAMHEFQTLGGKGLNITVPFKGDAYNISEQLSDRAKRAAAVNTISFADDGTIIGDNTDGVGLVRDLKINHQLSLQDKKILILGAGGAVRGVIAPLLEEHPKQLLIANRTVSRAEELVRLFSDVGNVVASGFTNIDNVEFDIVINGTSASLQGDVPPIAEEIIHHNIFCYDMMYSLEDTPFILWAKQHGAVNTADGLGMLVEQAAESFFIWRGVRPETASVIQSLSKS